MRQLLTMLVRTLPLLLAGCYGDWGTCRTDCQAGYHRTEFCDCEKTSPPGSGFPPPKPTGAAGRDFVWAATKNCSNNTIVFLYNITTIGVNAKYSYRDSKGNRNYSWMFVPAGIRNYADAQKYGTVLGYNLVDDAQCTVIGYQLEYSTSSASTTQKIREESLENLTVLSAKALSSARSQNEFGSDKNLLFSESRLTKILEKKVLPLNCSAECNPSPTINCLKGTPPDQEKIKELQSSMLSATNSSGVYMSTITKIFGLPPEDCEREDVKVTPTGLINNGPSCAFPIYFSAHDALPSVVIRYPETLSANQRKHNDLSFLEFVAPAEMPTIIFRNADINAVWGGHVLNVSVDSYGVYYQTSGGCIQMEVETQ